MTANTTPIFPITPNVVVGQTLTAANTSMTGTGTVATVYTAGANGGKPESIIFRAAGTNVATVARIFINNGSANSTATNNTLFAELTLPATTANAAAAMNDMRYQFPDNFRLPSSYTVLVTIGTAVSAGYAITCFGADY